MLIDLPDPLSLRTLDLRFSGLIAGSFADTQVVDTPCACPKTLFPVTAQVPDLASLGSR